MADSDKLPPTVGDLKQHIMRVHVQAQVWGQASTLEQVLLNPLQHGYNKDNEGHVRPTTTDVPPEAITEMVRCQCTKMFLQGKKFELHRPLLV